jgi:hypothetical protein
MSLTSAQIAAACSKVSKLAEHLIRRCTTEWVVEFQDAIVAVCVVRVVVVTISNEQIVRTVECYTYRIAQRRGARTGATIGRQTSILS